MDPNKFTNKEKKVTSTTEVEIISVEYLSPDYIIKPLSHYSTTDTGLLKVAELIPQKSEMPNFVFRWDENKDELDVDIYKEEKLYNGLWSEPGYSGHHTKRTVEQSKMFEVDINTPDKEIFKGKIDVGFFIQLTIKNSVKLTNSIKVVHKRIKIEDCSKGENHITVNERSEN